MIEGLDLQTCSDFDASGVEALRIQKFADRVSEMAPERIAQARETSHRMKRCVSHCKYVFAYAAFPSGNGRVSHDDPVGSYTYK